MNGFGISAATDLGLGSNLSQQVQDDDEEEKRKKKLGQSVLQNGAAQALGFNFGNTGVQAVKM